MTTGSVSAHPSQLEGESDVEAAQVDHESAPNYPSSCAHDDGAGIFSTSKKPTVQGLLQRYRTQGSRLRAIRPVRREPSRRCFLYNSLYLPTNLFLGWPVPMLGHRW